MSDKCEIQLRKLEVKDAPLMLGWMHYDSVVHNMQDDFASKIINDCCEFIENAQHTAQNMHLAIVDKSDEYMGTVSLKHIHNREAEFGITIRKSAMGKGISIRAMQSIIEIGFNRIGLERIFWCVNPMNARAVRFYDKNGHSRISVIPPVEGYTEEQIRGYYWYEVKK
jgi:diamine N-acetyltransferase